MPQTYNIYCDESCHLENDLQKVMVLGAVWCPADKAKEAADRLREIKAQHGMQAHFELKWTKVSPAKSRMYLDLVDYFFDDDDLHFRGLIVPDKSKIDHSRFDGQSHDVWYYKMHFEMLKALLTPQDRYRIYIDIKDTRGAARVRKLHEVLRSRMYDFDSRIVERVQTIRSHESELLQLADLLIGALSYANRGLSANAGKLALIERIRKRTGYQLDKSTLLREPKFNIFAWRAQEAAA